MREIFRGVYEKDGKIYTLNLVRGEKVYGENLIEIDGKEYREWNPHSSKLSAAIKKGLNNFPFNETSEVLYLGAASGTTASHISDICIRGMIYAVEFSPKVFKDLLNLFEKRKNISPLFLDARKVWETERFITKVDIIYQDVAQRDQTEILMKNVRFLLKGGIALYALKARSISSSKPLREIYRNEEKKLKDEFEIIEKIDLEPYEKEHRFYVLKKY